MPEFTLVASAHSLMSSRMPHTCMYSTTAGCDPPALGCTINVSMLPLGVAIAN